jgi:hypothetical protein
MKHLFAVFIIVLALAVVGTLCNAVSILAPTTVEAGCKGDKCD